MNRFPDQSISFLTLDTASADVTANNGTTLTYNNIDFRNILGSKLDEYEYFNLVLVNLLVSFNTFGNGVANRTLSVQLGGLNFLGCTYLASSKQFTDFPYLGFFILTGSTSNYYNYNTNNILTFRKPSVESITLRIRNVAGGIPDSSNAFPQAIFSMMIYGFHPNKTKMIQELQPKEQVPRDSKKNKK
jgi:hypothetical protein